ncbi:bifunctional riboflavin kinase/FAD synthetase [SAR86 cluster bacterium]|nr:bifunctional riboflavin kinase/FAD synthetase [SAR86 cluster bacterium]
MHLIRGINNIDFFKKNFPNAKLVATIGNFDGLHLGHKEIIKKMKSIGIANNLESLVIFTEPHAKEFFSANKDLSDQPTRISPWRDKFKRLKDNSIDYGFFLKFNTKLQKMTPENFIEEVLEKLNIQYLLIGDDFKFGKEREGDFDMLLSWGKKNNIQVSKIPTYTFEQKRVSSTRIRKSLENGDFNMAEKLLGRKYTFSGKVVFGNRLGRTIGVPTANIWVPKSNLPIKGVYAVKALIEKRQFNGIANMGIRPTVGGTSPVLEIHIFDFNKDIYGQRIEVEFHKKIREEKKFVHLDQLKDQISKDIEIAKKFLN